LAQILFASAIESKYLPASRLDGTVKEVRVSFVLVLLYTYNNALLWSAWEDADCTDYGAIMSWVNRIISALRRCETAPS
jgi:hypothetical protein